MEKRKNSTRKRKIPKEFQPFLWSVKIDDLDLNKDKVYIIHQILSYGNIKALNWLFNTYPLNIIKEVFLKHSLRIYREPSFNFVKTILLNINKPLDSKKYVSSLF